VSYALSMRAPGASRREILAGVPLALVTGACSRRDDRDVVRVIDAQATVDGAGVKLKRSLGSAALPLFDPFLLLDEFHSSKEEDYIAGFPSHPHRGFETVTYMLEGAVNHRDSLGNHGHLGAGSIQWMTAGRGIIHSEMPRGEGGSLWGFQLWVNLPASRKMTRPRYQDLGRERVAELEVDGARVRLVAGEAFGRAGPVDGIVTSPHMLDVALSPNGRFEHVVPARHNVFAYVFDGVALLGRSSTRVARGQVALFGPGSLIRAKGDEVARMLVLSAEPIGEPVARRGPFVMNTDEEIQKAIEDYRNGRLIEG
jgi:redox-sensitive bicupin YhaK (pirin superfamily)